MEGWEGGGVGVGAGMGGGGGGRGVDTPQNESKIKTESCCKIINVVYRAAVDTKMHTALILRMNWTTETEIVCTHCRPRKKEL